MKLISDTDPQLRQIATSWIFDSADSNCDIDAHLIEADLISLMKLHNGIGLAAPQTGLLKRVFVIQLTNMEPFAMFNPRLISSSDEEDGVEGCLSFPNLFLTIRRSNQIKVEYLNTKGELCSRDLEGIDARCFLHELDHLNGICFTNRVSKLKLNMARNKQRKYNG